MDWLASRRLLQLSYRDVAARLKSPHDRIDVMAQSSLPPEIRQLPVSDRLDLVERIWDSIIEDERQFQLTDAQKTELDRRLAAREASPHRAASWESVKAKLLGE
jgi:putative addiction module component (TIGR02574 family)